MPNDYPCWLDAIIAEQAAYYGQTPEKFAKSMSELAETQERIENCDPAFFDLY